MLLNSKWVYPSLSLHSLVFSELPLLQPHWISFWSELHSTPHLLYSVNPWLFELYSLLVWVRKVSSIDIQLTNCLPKLWCWIHPNLPTIAFFDQVLCLIPTFPQLLIPWFSSYLEYIWLRKIFSSQNFGHHKVWFSYRSPHLLTQESQIESFQISKAQSSWFLCFCHFFPSYSVHLVVFFPFAIPKLSCYFCDIITDSFQKFKARHTIYW